MFCEERHMNSLLPQVCPLPWKTSDQDKELLEHQRCRREAKQELQSPRDEIEHLGETKSGILIGEGFFFLVGFNHKCPPKTEEPLFSWVCRRLACQQGRRDVLLNVLWESRSEQLLGRRVSPRKKDWESAVVSRGQWRLRLEGFSWGWGDSALTYEVVALF